ncbi:MAG: RelA/SpoT domain-containing protein [Planctomycetes bacterium]|nr:RelA/SpoT domain-containing protein [Planctomycetota bacterium]
MSYPKPEFTKSQVNKAGKIITNWIQSPPGKITDEVLFANDVLNNWRVAHGYPVNTFQSTLRNKLTSIGVTNGLVAQRLKRWYSIVYKLRRFKTMRLDQMQDIGGLRAVVNSLDEIYLLRDSYHRSLMKSTFKHKLIAEINYIEKPKTSGYRGVHLVFQYCNDKAKDWEGLRLELQIRTTRQHIWATAVETMGTFLRTSLKSSEGPDKWLDFFTLSGTAFAHLEGTPPLKGYEHFSDRDIFQLVTETAKALDVRGKLSVFSVAVDAISNNNCRGSRHLVLLDIISKTVKIKSFANNQLQEANDEYFKLEKEITNDRNKQVVLVSATNIDELKRAYPNYFLDTTKFIKLLDTMQNAVNYKGQTP